MLPATSPSKKTFTNDIKSTIDASNAHRDALIPEDLNLALQNLGSRVRKSVTEGYNTQRVTTFTVPSTPCSSPTKPSNAQTTPSPVFISANDAFNSVFPTAGARPPLTPSPKKRPRAEVELSEVESYQTYNGDMDMDREGADREADDDQLMVILGPDADSKVFSLPRKIKPLRRSMAGKRTEGMLTDPLAPMAQEAEAALPVPSSVDPWIDMDLSEETAA